MPALRTCPRRVGLFCPDGPQQLVAGIRPGGCPAVGDRSRDCPQVSDLDAASLVRHAWGPSLAGSVPAGTDPCAVPAADRSPGLPTHDPVNGGIRNAQKQQHRGRRVTCALRTAVTDLCGDQQPLPLVPVVPRLHRVPHVVGEHPAALLPELPGPLLAPLVPPPLPSGARALAASTARSLRRSRPESP